MSSGAAEHGDNSGALEDVFLEIPGLFDGRYQLEDVIDLVADLTYRHIPATSAAIFFASDTGGLLYCAASRGQAFKAMSDLTLPIDQGIVALTLQSGRPVLVASPATDKRHTTPLVTAAGLAEESMLLAPVQSGERVFGVVLLVNRKGRKNGFSKYDANIASYIGEQLGQFVQHTLDAGPLD